MSSVVAHLNDNFYRDFLRFPRLAYLCQATLYRSPVWYLVKGLCEIHYDHVSLSVSVIQYMIQIANQIMEKMNQLGFARPLTSETMLTVSKNAFKGKVLVCIAYNYMRQGFATDASERHWSIICCIIFLPYLENSLQLLIIFGILLLFGLVGSHLCLLNPSPTHWFLTVYMDFRFEPVCQIL